MEWIADAIITVLFISGTISISISLLKALIPKLNRDSDAVVKFIGIKIVGPWTFAIGIAALIIAWFIFDYEQSSKFKDEIKVLTSENTILKSEIDSLKQITEDSTLFIPSKFTISLNEEEVKSILGSKVLVSYERLYGNSCKLIFNGILGISKNSVNGFKGDEIRVDVGDKIFIKTDSNEIYGVNILELSYLSIKLEFYKYKSSNL